MNISKALVFTFLLQFSYISLSHAGSYNLPALEERKFSLETNNLIDVEIITGQITEQVNNRRFTGYTYISWTDEAFSSGAENIRNSLVKKGFSPDWIIMQREAGGYNNPVQGVLVTLQEIIQNPQECNYSAMSYRFSYDDESGCALNSMRDSSIVNPYKYYF